MSVNNGANNGVNPWAVGAVQLILLIVFLGMLIMEVYWGGFLALDERSVPTRQFVYFDIWTVVKALTTCVPLIMYRSTTTAKVSAFIIIIPELFWLYILARGMDIFGFHLPRPLTISLLVAILANFIVTGTCLSVLIDKVGCKWYKLHEQKYKS